MRYALEDLIDIPKLQELTDALYAATGIPSSIVDINGKILTGSGWQRICTEFHRRHPDIERACIESNTRLRERTASGEPFVVYECPMGLVHASSPIVIDGDHMANVLSGQVLAAPPDEAMEERFRQQARAFGLDEEAYLAAFRELRVFPPEEFREALRFLVKLAELVASLGLLRTRELEASRALAESETRVARIVETVPDGIAIVGADGRITFANAAAERILRLQRQDVTARTYNAPEWRITAADGGPFPDEELPVARVLRTGESVEGVVHAIEHPDGTRTILSINAAPLRDERGGVSAVVTSFTDITERMRGEATARESHELLAAFIRHSPIYAFIKEVTPEASRVLVASENYVDMVGVPGSQMTGMTMEELFPPESAAKITADDQAVVAGGEVLRLDEDLGGRHYTTIKFPITLGDRRLLAGYTIDITERTRAETRLRESEAELRRLLELSDQSRLALLSLAEDQQRTEAALRESEARYRLIADNASDVIWILELPELRFSYVSPSVEKLRGYTPEEVMAQPFAAALTPEGYASLMEELSRQMETVATGAPPQRTYVRELQQPRKDGTLVETEVVATVLTDEDGRPVKVVGVTRDITARKAAERALRESEQRYQTLAESSPVGIFRTDATGSTTYVNPRWCEISGMSRDEALGWGWLDRLHPDDRETLATGWRQAVGDGLASTAEYRLVRPDGSVAWVLGRAVPERAADGTITGWVGTITDITERRQAEEALRRAEAFQRAVIESSPLAIFSLDPDGHVTGWNPAAERLFGWRAEEVLGQALPTVDEAHRQEFDTLRGRVLQGEVLQGVDLVRRTKDGRTLDVRLWAAAIRDAAGRAVGIMASMEDVSERKAAATALAKRAHELATVHRISQQLRTLMPPQQLADLMILTLEELLGYQYGAVLLLDETGTRLVPFALSDQGHGPDFVESDREYVTSHEIVKGRGITGWVAATGESVRVGDVAHDPRYIEIRPGVRSELCVPLRIGNDVVGVINVESVEPDAFSADDQRLLETVADVFAVAAHNARLFDQVRGLAARLVQVEESERAALARELHDRVGQTLTALSLNLSMLAGALPDGVRRAVEAPLRDAQELVAEAAQEIRSVMADLRPPVLDDYGLAAALRFEAERLGRRSGLAVSVHGEDLEPRPSAAVETALFRAVQEALTNVVKHARASRAEVSVERADGVLRVVVADDGVGFDATAPPRRGASGGWGLVGMRERLQAVGGHVAVDSAVGRGTRVIIEVGATDASHSADRR